MPKYFSTFIEVVQAGEVYPDAADGNDDKAANDAVSDHRPVWATFRINTDDDGQIADVTRDGKVDALDLVIVAANFGNPKPIPAADITGDGEVNRKDILIVLDALEAALGESPE